MKYKSILLTLLSIFFIENIKAQFFEQIKNTKVLSSETIEWKPVGPGTSGYCEEFWCHPTDVNTMFMGPDMHAAFGTWDGGKTWQTLKDSDGVGLDMRRVIDIQFSTKNSDFGIAFASNQTGTNTAGRIYKTNDRGRSWEEVSVLGKVHSKIAIHPTNDAIWFVGAGDFWNVKANHRRQSDLGGLKQGRSAYGYVWKTTNSGASWKKVATNISNDLDVGRIIVNPKNPNVLVMATSHGMYRSTDTGETWVSSNSGLPNDLPRDLTSFYDGSNFVLYAVEQTVFTENGNAITNRGGVFKSLDNGLTWQSITGNLGINMQTINDFTNRDNYHRAMGYWFGISKNDSKAKHTVYPTNVLPIFNRIVVNPKNKDEIYLVHNKRHDFSFGPGDVWKTEDGGTTWFPCSRTGEYWIAGTHKTYWQTKNNKVAANITFAHMQRYMDEKNEISSAARMLAINSDGDVFTGINQQLLRSNNGGETWQQEDDDELRPGSNQWIGRGGTALPGRYMLLETGVPGRRLFCSGEHGLWKTVDLGDYYNRDAVAVEQIEGQIYKDGAHSISTVAVHPNDPNTIYFLSWRQEHRGKLRKSTDGGKTWTNIATIFEGTNGSWENLPHQFSLLIDPNNPNNMYFCSIKKALQEVGSLRDDSVLTKGGYGVYKSTDGGVHWSLSNSGLPNNGSVRRLTMDPKNSSILYASINQWGNNDIGGLYKSTNKGSSWNKMSIPSIIKSVNNLFIDRNTNDMFISCGNRNGNYTAGGVWKSSDNGSSWTQLFKAPYVWQTEVSPVNSNIITVNAAVQIPNLRGEFLNPGAYISRDGGATWTKINKGLAHPGRITDLKPDPYDESVLWSAGWGSAWYKAIIPSADVTAVCQDITVKEGEEVSLSALASIGTKLKYKWVPPVEISLSSTDGYKTSFTAPLVGSNKQKIYTIDLTVSNDLDDDKISVQITVTGNVDIEEIHELNEIVVSPNPIKDRLLKIQNLNEASKFYILNVDGKVLYTSTVEKDIPFKLPLLSNGVYLLKIKTSKGEVTKKLIIEGN